MVYKDILYSQVWYTRIYCTHRYTALTGMEYKDIMYLQIGYTRIARSVVLCPKEFEVVAWPSQQLQILKLLQNSLIDFAKGLL